jgi:hypothetical protein
MSHPAELKRISADAIGGALRKAQRYRLLDEPGQAESICLDILEIESEHQEALSILILAMTDTFGRDRSRRGARETHRLVARILNDYERTYLGGIVFEREAKAMLGRGPARSFAYEGFREAMSMYEEAERNRPPGNDDAILRWNSCVRAIQREKLEPKEEARELPLE